QYAFYGLAASTYVIREAPPAGSLTTLPSTSASTYSTNFDTIAGGTTLFTVQGATFSGGSVFAPSSSTLLASGTHAWNVSTGTASLDVNWPIRSVTFFYVHGPGFAAGTATASAVDGSVLGTVNSPLATSFNDPNNYVTLSFTQPVARLRFSAGIVDTFSFTT